MRQDHLQTNLKSDSWVHTLFYGQRVWCGSSCREVSALLPSWMFSTHLSICCLICDGGSQWLTVDSMKLFVKIAQDWSCHTVKMQYVVLIFNILFSPSFCLVELRVHLSPAFHSQLPLISFILDSLLPFAALNCLSSSGPWEAQLWHEMLAYYLSWFMFSLPFFTGDVRIKNYLEFSCFINHIVFQLIQYFYE